MLMTHPYGWFHGLPQLLAFFRDCPEAEPIKIDEADESLQEVVSKPPPILLLRPHSRSTCRDQCNASFCNIRFSHPQVVATLNAMAKRFLTD